jgi:hypothetical protein
MATFSGRSDYRRYLRVGNDRNILQRTHWAELRRLRLKRRERRCRKQHANAVHPALRGPMAAQ